MILLGSDMFVNKERFFGRPNSWDQPNIFKHFFITNIETHEMSKILKMLKILKILSTLKELKISTKRIILLGFKKGVIRKHLIWAGYHCHLFIWGALMAFK